MRRSSAALAAFSLVFTVAGCGAAEEPEPVAPAAAPAAPLPLPSGAAPGIGSTSGTAVVSGNSEKLCAEATKLGAAFGETFVADLRAQIGGASPGTPAKAGAGSQLARDVEDYSAALADLAKKSTDDALAAALTSMSKEVTALKGDIESVDAEKMWALSATLDKACGRG